MADDTLDSETVDQSNLNLDKALNYGLEFFKAFQKSNGNQSGQTPAPVAAPAKTYGGFTILEWALGFGAIGVVIVLIRWVFK